MAQKSAGILLYRRRKEGVEVLLVHPGGPFWAKKDDGAWTVPKGLVDPGEDPLAAAQREFQEETGFTASGPFALLGTFRQPGGKLVMIWSAEGDCDPSKLVSNLFEMEWPPRSGRKKSFPEIDRGQWCDEPEALSKVLKGQREAIALFFKRERDQAPRAKTS
jgi:predicted NUDIX family NTP pyrophosphohydrolase